MYEVHIRSNLLTWSHDASAAVDGQGLAGDEGGGVGGQESDGLGHLVRLANAAHGVSGFAVLQKGLISEWIKRYLNLTIFRSIIYTIFFSWYISFKRLREWKESSKRFLRFIGHPCSLVNVGDDDSGVDSVDTDSFRSHFNGG